MLYGTAGLIIILLIGIIILSVKLNKKIILDTTEKTKYENEVQQLKQKEFDLSKSLDKYNELINAKSRELNQYKLNIENAQEKYAYETRDRTAELDSYFSTVREQRQDEIDKHFDKLWKDTQQSFDLKKESLRVQYQKMEQECQDHVKMVDEAANHCIEWAQQRANAADKIATEQEQKFNALLAPIQQYEKEKQEKLFYTIQVPDEYKEDIEFLLTTVSKKIAHPDVINKLVWTEYAKPYIDDTFKRVGIKDESGIYKLTSLIDGKCYIGKSTNIKKRITDHVKGSCGIKAIAYQSVHDAMAREGYWNWTIEPIIYCEKDKLNELEKYYIEFFKSQSFGYNKNSGGGG